MQVYNSLLYQFLNLELDALGDELNFEEEEEPSYLQETPELPNTGLGELDKTEVKNLS